MLKFKKIGTDKIPVLLVTANVGSIFEDPSVMLPIWTTEFLQTVSKMEHKFIALHLQEVGGKTYEKSMQYVQDFITRLCDSPELRLFDKVRAYLDEDFSSPEKFTALGNMYFVHSSLTEVKLWDFELKNWVSVEGKEIHTGSIEKVTTKEKTKFPQHFFPECKWSRKGFLRTRWQLRGTAIELVNIHLFHDASNLVAMETFPSVYCRSRRRALRHTLRHLHSDVNAAPYFIFGDFNFRLDTGAVVTKLTEELTTCRVHNTNKSADHTKMQYKSETENRVVLSVGKKEFIHVEHQKVFREPWMQQFDRELEALKPHLFEFPIKFPPSYPFEENVELPTHYMKTRCPSWCDRILLSQTARLLLQQQPDAMRGPAAGDKPAAAPGSRKSMVEADNVGGSPSRGNLSSNQTSSSESSPARSLSPAQASQQSPAKKQNTSTEWEGLCVPGITMARKSIADPTSLQHAINARVAENSDNSSPTRRRLVRNQSEGSPKAPEQSELRRLMEGQIHPSLRKRIDYGMMGESTCMGDHKPIYLRIMLQSDRGMLSCCTLDSKNNLCFSSPQLDACVKCSSTASLFYNNNLTANRLPPFAKHTHKRHSLLRLGTDPNLIAHRDKSTLTANALNNVINNDKRTKSGLKRSISSFAHSENNIYLQREAFETITDLAMTIPNVEISLTNDVCCDEDHIYVNEIDTHLLYSENAFHGPYTPESADSHSPNPEACSTIEAYSDSTSNELPNYFDSSLKHEDVAVRECLLEKDLIKNHDRSVSPGQLKSRLLLLTEEVKKDDTHLVPRVPVVVTIPYQCDTCNLTNCHCNGISPECGCCLPTCNDCFPARNCCETTCNFCQDTCDCLGSSCAYCENSYSDANCGCGECDCDCGDCDCDCGDCDCDCGDCDCSIM